jgi:acyl-CoA thioesterase-1
VLQQLLREQGRDATVVNAGLSGETTAGGLRRLDWVLRGTADCLVIALGGNDALRGLPVAETRDNLRAMIHKARERQPGIRIILAGMLAPPNMGPDYAAAFAAVYPQLAREENVELFDFLLQDVAARPELNLEDGIHPNAAGHRQIAQSLLSLLLRD